MRAKVKLDLDYNFDRILLVPTELHIIYIPSGDSELKKRVVLLFAAFLTVLIAIICSVKQQSFRQCTPIRQELFSGSSQSRELGHYISKSLLDFFPLLFSGITFLFRAFLSYVIFSFNFSFVCARVDTVKSFIS